jgi:hypothetical protein
MVFDFLPHQWWTKTLFSPHPCQHLLRFTYLIIAIETLVRWCLTVILICISLVITYVKPFFMYLMATCLSSFEKFLLRSFAHSLFCLVVFLLFSWVKKIREGGRYWGLNSRPPTWGAGTIPLETCP